jgi:tRNA threonylcarbamoyladenosine biosynthesis protein TsaE
MEKIITKTEKQTLNLGKKLAKSFNGGEVVALIGNLGSGKTVLAKGIAEGLGIKGHVTSPTFVLLKPYVVKGDNIKKLVHIDAYRLTSGRDMEAIGATEFFDRDDCVTIVEWADRVKDILPKDLIIVKFNIRGKNREINIRR